MFKRSDSRIYWTSVTINGKRQRVSLKTSDPKVARLKERKLKLAVETGEALDKPRGDFLTISWLLDKYLGDHSKPNKRSYVTDTYLVKPLRKYFGKLKLTALKPSHVSGYKSDRRKSGRKVATIRNELALLSNAYTLAFKEWDLINENPFLKVKLPVPDNKRVRWLTDEEREKLFSVKRFEWMYPTIITLRETGVRLTNVLELQWSQVDFKRKMILFPMTKNGRPVGLPMTNVLFDTLLSLRKNQSQQKIVSMSGYVFPKKDGFPRGRRTFERSFKALCRDAGIEDLVPHDLRHDCATRLIRAGVHLKTIMDWLGHSSLSMTLRYAHLGRDEVMENAARMLSREG